jgi:Uma2 family endonuclease
MDAILEPLVRSPKLNLYLRDLEHLASEEQVRRSRFYDEMSEQRKMEFINGEIIMHSPVKIEHEFASSSLLVLLRAFVMRRRMGYVGHEKMLVTLTRNDYEPDVCYWRKEVAATFEKGQMKFPAPDFVAEVLSASTKEQDYGVKFQDYEAHGVREYWIVNAQEELVEQYALFDGKFSLLKKTDSGSITSRAVEGFTIPIRALFDEDDHLAALEKLILSAP